MTDHKTLSSALQLAGAPISAAEAHGVMTGSLCANRHDENGHWLALILGNNDPDQLRAQAPLVRRLATAYGEARQALGEADFSHELLLPSDDASLADRVEAVADWTRGFLLGLMENGVRDPSSLSGDAGEFMQDLMAIAEVVPTEQGEQEEEEKALAELVEYVRIGVRLVYEALNPPATISEAVTRH